MEMKLGEHREKVPYFESKCATLVPCFRYVVIMYLRLAEQPDRFRQTFAVPRPLL